MLLNYLKIALRNILRNKIFSAINVIGLSISIAVSFCIIVFVTYQLSYDKHHSNFDNIYRVDSQLNERDINLPRISFPLGLAIKEEIPEIDEVARCFEKEKLDFQYENSSYQIKNTFFADPAIFNIFDYEIKEGNRTKFFVNANSAVLNERTALKLFGRSDVIGETISFNYEKVDVEVQVTGIIKSEDRPSSVAPDVFFPLELLFKIDNYFEKDNWVQVQGAFTFLLIPGDVNLASIENKIRQINNRHLAETDSNIYFLLKPLKDTYFIDEANYINYVMPVIHLDEILIYSSIAFLILILACINFVLLTSAKSSSRYLEFGIRKVVGAKKRDVILQIIIESIITMLLTIPLTLLFIELLFPHLQELVTANIYPSFYYNITYVIILLFVNIIIGTITGWYIALSMFRRQSAEIFRKNINPNNSIITIRRALLLFQMVVFIGLLVATLVLKGQMNFIYNTDPGYDADNVLNIMLRDIRGKEDAFKNSVIQYSSIKDYSFNSHIFPLYRGATVKFSKSKKSEEKFLMASPSINNDYPRFLKMKLIAGRYPEKDNKVRKIVLNETAAKLLEFDDPVGNYIYLFGIYQREIIGIVKDFHIHSMKDEIMPVAMELSNRGYRLALRIEKGREIETINFLKTKWKEFTDSPFNFEFTLDRLKYAYAAEINFEKLIDLFTALAVLISSMGLFGLVMFSTRQRTKEIGVRKVLGASVVDILKLISKEFMILVVAGSLIAFPIAYYFMSQWLDNFAYKIKITSDIFLVALLLALLITFLTISIQIVKATRLNPINSLRNE